MPRLLIVTTVAATLRAFLLPYARRFRALGWRVDALARDASNTPGCIEAFDACHDVALSRQPWRLRGVRSSSAAIRALVSREGYDIVHVHTPVAAFVTRMALRELRRAGSPKVVYTAHGFHFHRGGHPLKNAVFLNLERLAARWTDRLIVINAEDRDAAVRWLMPPERVIHMPGIGLDLRAWDREAVISGDVSVRDELGLDDGDALFLMVASFDPGKRHRDALDALALTGRSDIHLALAGTGPLEDDVRAQAARLGVAGRVHFLGRRDDVPRLMLASLATVLPSEREGLNRSVMESIALGVPVLGAGARGIRDLITDPSRGVLFPVGDASALAKAMVEIADDPPKERPRPDPAWDIRELLRAHEELYAGLISTPRAAPPTATRGGQSDLA